MYKYTKKTIVINFVFVGMLVISAIFLSYEIWFRLAIGIVSILIFKDAIKEMNATFELTGDRMVIKSKGKVSKEIRYKEMDYLTITRKNKKWIVIADDEKILFTIKPKIENYEQMVSELIKFNKSNKKLEVHDYIKKTYK